jgi:hypothetical protein
MCDDAAAASIRLRTRSHQTTRAPQTGGALTKDDRPRKGRGKINRTASDDCYLCFSIDAAEGAISLTLFRRPPPPETCPVESDTHDAGIAA